MAMMAIIRADRPPEQFKSSTLNPPGELAYRGLGYLNLPGSWLVGVIGLSIGLHHSLLKPLQGVSR